MKNVDATKVLIKGTIKPAFAAVLDVSTDHLHVQSEVNGLQSTWRISTSQSGVIEPALSHDLQVSTPREFCKFSKVQPFSCLFSIHLLFLDVEKDTEAVIFNSVISACETLGHLQGHSSGSEDGDGKLETLQFNAIQQARRNVHPLPRV